MAKFYIAEYTQTKRVNNDFDSERVERGVIGLFDNFDSAKRYARDFYENVGEDYPTEYENESISTTENKKGDNDIKTWHSYSYKDTDGDNRIIEEIHIHSIELNNNSNPYEDIITFHVG